MFQSIAYFEIVWGRFWLQDSLVSSLCCKNSSDHRVKPSLATGIHKILHPQPTHPVTPQHPHKEPHVCQAASVAFALPWPCWGNQNPVAWAKGRVAACQLEVSKKCDVAGIPFLLACEIPCFFLGFHGSKKKFRQLFMWVGVYCYKWSLWHRALGMKESFTERNPRLVKYSIQIDFATNHC